VGVRASAFGGVLLCATALVVAPFSRQALAQESTVAAIRAPKIWDKRELETWATPLAGLGVPPRFVSEEDYYAAPVDNLRTYPVYHPEHEPRGYREALVRRGPLPLIEPEKLRTLAEWIHAGRRVFEELDTASSRSDDPSLIAHFTSAKSVDAYRDVSHDVMTKEGVLLDYRWVVDRAGALKLSFSSCAGCHSRLMPDGSMLAGAPCNFDLSSAPVLEVMFKDILPLPHLTKGEGFYRQYGVPWLKNDPHERIRKLSDRDYDAFAALDAGDPPGTMFARFNGSPLFKTRMADLRGIRDRRYLDATGTHLHRGPEDIARYAILVEFADAAVFGPHHMLPAEVEKVRFRPPDEAMYALALYVESLDPAPSPLPFDERAKKGEKVFESEGCARCHTPPVYTNNKLIPVPGFEPPANDALTAKLDISNRRVNTDPGLALQTRKGTGYYKVPSLRGLWYRGLYGHSGFVTSLEDWFDPRRLRSDYVPSGWRGPGVRALAVVGHDFGLDLSSEDRASLIAFLRTL
jgi:hypothetical protein